MEASLSRRTVLMGAALGLLGSVALTRTAEAAPMSFNVPLSGAQQVPPVDTKGTGTAHLTYDSATRVLTWSVRYHGLSSRVTMAHFHGPAAAGANAGVQVWISKKGSSVRSPVKGSATLTPDQAKALMAGEWYVNVHTKKHPAGEIRGQVKPPMG
ncbi:MAG: CHRD domain-containing protein [Acetobacteraceae bacterium]